MIKINKKLLELFGVQSGAVEELNMNVPNYSLGCLPSHVVSEKWKITMSPIVKQGLKVIVGPRKSECWIDGFKYIKE